MANKTWIWVKNPSGRNVEVDAEQWPVLEKQGFQLLGDLPTTISSPTSSPVRNPDAADLNFVASFWASNGMGRVGEEILLALDRLGLKINVQSLYTVEEGLQERTKQLLGAVYPPSHRTLLFSIPQPLEQYHTEETYLAVPWDTNKAPAEWVSLINKYCKKVYPVSHFTRETLLTSGVIKPMETIKHGVRFDLFPEIKRDWSKTYTFLTFGDLSTRKGTDCLIRAFQKSFPKRIKDVRLIIKSNNTMEWGRIAVPDDDRIQVIEETYTHTQLLKLMQESHCFVLPSRAEGFGLPALEAMSTGMPTIIHNYGGLSMMANDRYNYPVKSAEPMEIPEWHYPEEYFKDGGIGKWVSPDEKHLASLMKYVYQRRDEGKEKGHRAAKWVRSNWGWDEPIKRMWEDMVPTKITKSWGDFYNKDTLTKNNVQDSVNSHKELFWTILGFKPKKIIETGCGTGEMAGWLSWKDKTIEGKKLLKEDSIKEVIAIDIDPKVIEIAKTNLDAIDGNVRLVKADAWTYKEEADLIFSQGLLEHFSDQELKSLIDHQLEQAPVLVHSVPNANYGKLDFGNERLMSANDWYKIFAGYNLHIYNYWDVGDKKIQSILIFFRGNMPCQKTSIIMPVFNHKDITIKAIEAVRANTKDYELIVIDNNSNDGIEKWLDEQSDITTLHISQNLGVPRAKNLGVAIAKGNYICFLDNDTEAGPNWLSDMIKVFDDPTIGFTAHEGYFVDYENHSFLGPKHTTSINPEWASGSVFVYPKKLTRDIGELIDYDFWCVEDVDFCCKIRNAGYLGKISDTPINIKHSMSQTASRFDFSVDRFNKWANKVWTEWESFMKANKDGGIRIDIGVGDAPAVGYLHVDIQQKYHVDIIADCRNLPFETNTLAEVRNAHLIEHFTRMEVDKLLDEWIRVLKKDGLLRIICPDFKQICSKFIKGEIDTERALLWTYGGQIDQYDYHYWMYTPETLCALFNKHGLTGVTWRYTNEGWLEVTGNKQIETTTDITATSTSSTAKIGVYITHTHIHGGGENHTFKTLQILGKLYPNQVEVASSELWAIDPKEFGIELKGIKKVDKLADHYPTFLNISHFELHEPIGDRNYVWIYYPQYDWKDKLKPFKLITQSKFIQDEIKTKWGLESQLAYPPCDISQFYIGKKENIILNVGRFFKVDGGNNKNQEFLIEAFKQMPPGWRLILIGSVQNEEYFKQLADSAKGFNVEFKHDITFEELTELYSRSKIYWHAAGYGTKEPSCQEHFGMVAVEALASGCQTLVYNGGGMAQIDGVKIWQNKSDLLVKTLAVRTKPEELREYTKKYSIEEVTKMWDKIIK